MDFPPNQSDSIKKDICRKSNTINELRCIKAHFAICITIGHNKGRRNRLTAHRIIKNRAKCETIIRICSGECC
jgi:hypothetical protein